MGYNTRWTGNITINPPLKWSAFKDSPFHPEHNQENGKSLRLMTRRYERETPEGLLDVREAYGVEFGWDRPVKTPTLPEELQEIIDEAGEQHHFSGTLHASGEEWADVWKVTVIDGKAVTQYPEIHWPDGSVQPSRWVTP